MHCTQRNSRLLTPQYTFVICQKLLDLMKWSHVAEKIISITALRVSSTCEESLTSRI